jgi:hypothetical protein
MERIIDARSSADMLAAAAMSACDGPAAAVAGPSLEVSASLPAGGKINGVLAAADGSTAGCSCPGTAGAIGTPPSVGVAVRPSSAASAVSCPLSDPEGANTAKARSSAVCALSRFPVTAWDRTSRSHPAILSGFSASLASSPSIMEAIIAWRSSALMFCAAAISAAEGFPGAAPAGDNGEVCGCC